MAYRNDGGGFGEGVPALPANWGGDDDPGHGLSLHLRGSDDGPPPEAGCLICWMGPGDLAQLLAGDALRLGEIDLAAVRRGVPDAAALCAERPFYGVALLGRSDGLQELGERAPSSWLWDDGNLVTLSLAVCDDGSVHAVVGVTHAGVLAMAGGVVLGVHLPDRETLLEDGLLVPPTGLTVIAGATADECWEISGGLADVPPAGQQRRTDG